MIWFDTLVSDQSLVLPHVLHINLVSHKHEYGKTLPFLPHHSAFYEPDALPAAQPTASKH